MTTVACSRRILILCSLLWLACADDDAGRSPDEQEPPRDAGAASWDARVALDAAAAPRVDSQVPVLDPADAGRFDPTSALYSGSEILEVQIELAPADWDTLRTQGRTMDAIFTGCEDPSFEYDELPARVRIASETFERVSVRKKGFLGSLSVRKPSLRLDFDTYDASQRVSGAKSLTLNNGLQDPAAVKQCLAYSFMNRVGIPAPRCGFARVTVNGQLLGIYSNVEPVKKPFLRRVFGEDEGTLYEGSAPADFRHDLLKNFEKKTHEDVPGRPELEALAQALLAPDETLVEALTPVLDLDSYFRYWAASTLLADWDSYDGNQNNYFVYFHPGSKKLSFIPWGVDGSFDRKSWSDKKLPKSVLANALLSRRLYKLASTRERYRQAMRDLLAQWDEARLLSELDQMAGLLSPTPSATKLEELRSFVREREAELRVELDQVAPEWPLISKLADNLLRCDPTRSTPVRGTFSTTWNSDESAAALLGNSLAMELRGAPVPPALLTFASADVMADASALPTSFLRLTLIPFAGDMLIVQFIIGKEVLPAGDVSTHGFETFGIVLEETEKGAPLTIRGFISLATLHFEQASGTKGAPIAGSFEGKYVGFEP